MAELSNDIPKELWDKILFTDVPIPTSYHIGHNNPSYIFVNPYNTESSFIWLLPDGRLVKTEWTYSQKDGPLRPEALVYIGQGYFHHQQQRKI